MTDLFETFTDAIAGFLRHPLVQLAIQLTVAYLVIVWLATAWWTFRDLRQRTRDPFTPYLAAGGVVVFTPFAFLLPLIAYRIVRPPETLAERRTRDLEAYVLTAEVTKAACTRCGLAVDDEWMRCPGCGNQLAMGCHACGGRIEPDWSVCAWCARDLEPFGSPSVEAPSIPLPAAVLELEPAEAAPRGAIPGWRAVMADSDDVASSAASTTSFARTPRPSAIQAGAGSRSSPGRGGVAVATRERESKRLERRHR